MKKHTPKYFRNKADGKLTPIIKLLYPKCLLCPRPTEVAHHHVHKSKSTRLRYEIDNLINLCHSCHFTLHNNESYWASRIIQINGLKWFAKLEKMKNEIVKADVYYFQSHYERLQKYYQSLLTNLAK